MEGMGNRYGGNLVVRQGNVGSVRRVGSVGRPSKVGGIIVPVSFWEVSPFRPNFKALKGAHNLHFFRSHVDAQP